MTTPTKDRLRCPDWDDPTIIIDEAPLT